MYIIISVKKKKANVFVLCLTIANAFVNIIITIANAFVNNQFGGEQMRISRIKLHTQMLIKDVSTVKLSKETGISRATISGIRGGKSCLNETAEKIAQALKCKVEDLLED